MKGKGAQEGAQGGPTGAQGRPRAQSGDRAGLGSLRNPGSARSSGGVFCDKHDKGVRDPVEYGAALFRIFLKEVLVQDGEQEENPSEEKHSDDLSKECG